MLCLAVTSSYEGCPASYWQLTVSQDDRSRHVMQKTTEQNLIVHPVTAKLLVDKVMANR